jgi:hypothetical protein
MLGTWIEKELQVCKLWQRRPYRRRQAHSCALRRFGPVAPQALPTYHRNRDMSALRNEPAPFCAFYG